MTEQLGHLQISEIRMPPGEEWPPKIGPWRVVLVQSGMAYWLGASRPRSLSEGEMIIIGPKTKGCVRASQLGETILHTFGFLPDLFCGFFTLAERHYFETCSTTDFVEAKFLPSTHPATKHFAVLVADPEAQPSLLRRTEVLSLVICIFEGGIERHRLPDLSRLSAGRRFQKMISQMPDVELLNHSTEDLAQMCGCNVRHLNRLFKQHFGTSPRKMQIDLRLLKASQLLAGTKTKIVEVASASGYRNVSLFNRMFKKRFGMTPPEFRRESS